MIKAPMTKFHLVGAGPVSQGKNLMTHADAKYWQVFLNLSHHFSCGRHFFGIAGTIGKQNAIRMQIQDFLSRC